MKVFYEGTEDMSSPQSWPDWMPQEDRELAALVYNTAKGMGLMDAGGIRGQEWVNNTTNRLFRDSGVVWNEHAGRFNTKMVVSFFVCRLAAFLNGTLRKIKKEDQQ